MPTLPLVLLASARPAGDTAALVRAAFGSVPHVVHDLRAAPLAPYCYAGTYPADDAFLALVHQLVAHDTLVLATPVYWYAMSGLLKTFFDRLTDLITIQKPLGRQLRGKRLLVLAVGANVALPPGFEEPFRRTAAYLGLAFGGCWYYSSGRARPAALARLARQWQQALAARPVPPTTSLA